MFLCYFESIIFQVVEAPEINTQLRVNSSPRGQVKNWKFRNLKINYLENSVHEFRLRFIERLGMLFACKF